MNNICSLQTKIKPRGKKRYRDLGDFLYAKKGRDIVVIIGGRNIKENIDRIWINEGAFAVEKADLHGSCINLKLKD